MIYLDTNIIIYAIENHPKYGNSCKQILEDIQNKKLKASSSILVLIEIINVLTKINKIIKSKKENELNIKENINAILSIPITWIDLGLFIIKLASEYNHNISGVDYIHIASMEVNSIKKIISADIELDKVHSISRIDPLKYT